MRKRVYSEIGIYHATNKGAGEQLIFLDDLDRKHFLKLLKVNSEKHQVKVLAWCLMSSHFHLLLNGDMADISRLMQALDGEYAQDFNERYDRVGHLFGSRFFSAPIETPGYFLSALRYIHNNPVRAGIVLRAKDYRWSSYREYIGQPYLANTDMALCELGGVDGFCRFSDQSDDIPKRVLYKGLELNDDEALEIARDLLGSDNAAIVHKMGKPERNASIAALHDARLTISQISRLTGVSRMTVRKIVGSADAA